jgi:hypothetical protein
LIIIGVLLLCVPISFVVASGIGIFLVANFPFNPGVFAVILLGLVVLGAFHITGGVFCIRREYWGVCLASASFAVFFSALFSRVSLFLLSINMLMECITWGTLVAAVLAVIFILRTKKEWQEISDSVDGKVSYGG